MANIFRPPCDEAVIEARAADATCSQRTGLWVLAATILGSSMAFIDGTVVNIALPILQRELGMTAAEAQWIVQSYSLMLAALILVGGALGDRLGRRRSFTFGIVLFTLASAGCGIAQSFTQLVIARAVQGLGAALLVPQSLAIISASFEEQERGRAIGTWSGFTSLTAAAGPVIGGLLIAAGSWRYAFFLNVPIAVLALACTPRVPESRDTSQQPPLDWLGAALATIGLGALVYGFTTASSGGFRRPDVITTLAIAVVALAVFVQVERTSRGPMVSPLLFQSRTFTGANLFTLLLYAPLGGALYFVPFNLIQVQHYSPQAAGAALLPFVLLMFLLSRWSGGLVARYGARRPLIIGPLVAAAGFALFALPAVDGDYWRTFFPAFVVLGLGMAIAVAPLTTTVMDSVERAHASLASGINNAVSRTAGVLALAILSVVAAVLFSHSLSGRLATLNVPAEVAQAMDAQSTKLAAASPPASVNPDMAAALRLAVSGSFVTSFRAIMLLGAGLAVSASACAALTVPGVQGTAVTRPRAQTR